jgi:hypothetical protein
LSIFTAAFAAEAWSLALTLGDPANNRSIAITTGVAKLANHTRFFVIVLVPSSIPFSFLIFLIVGCWDQILGNYPRGASTTKRIYHRSAPERLNPDRSVTRCAEPVEVGFIPRQIFVSSGNKLDVRLFTVGSTPWARLPQRVDKQLVPQALSNRPSPIPKSGYCVKSKDVVNAPQF